MMKPLSSQQMPHINYALRQAGHSDTAADELTRALGVLSDHGVIFLFVSPSRPQKFIKCPNINKNVPKNESNDPNIKNALIKFLPQNQENFFRLFIISAILT